MNAVNARELWAKLESKQRFTDWIKGRIEKYGFVEGTDYAVRKITNGESSGFQPIEKYDFVENVDFCSFNESVKRETGGRPTIDYYISLDMAKELSMVENNAQGKQARRYFIECEKQAKSLPKFDHLSPEVIDWQGSASC